MISLIICSRTPRISSLFEENIASSIGAAYEIVVIDNSKNQYSIFEAYNRALERSRGSIQVFVHDDVLFHTQNWGRILSGIFEKDEKIGLVGIAGSTVKTQMPSPWWGGPGKKYNYITQHYEGAVLPKQLEYGFNGRTLAEVAVIDGVFMAMKRDERISFDRKLEGFHNYDLDLSIKHHHLHKKVVVTNRIKLEHFSGGRMNKDWYRSADLFHRHHKLKLPVLAGVEMTSSELEMHEFTAAAVFINGLLDMKMKKEAFYWWFLLIKMKAYSRFHLRLLKRFVLN